MKRPKNGNGCEKWERLRERLQKRSQEIFFFYIVLFANFAAEITINSLSITKNEK